MLKDDLDIQEKNWEVHKDIQQDMVIKKSGVFSFSLRVSNGEICDYIVMENERFTVHKLS